MNRLGVFRLAAFAGFGVLAFFRDRDRGTTSPNRRSTPRV